MLIREWAKMLIREWAKILIREWAKNAIWEYMFSGPYITWFWYMELCFDFDIWSYALIIINEFWNEKLRFDLIHALFLKLKLISGIWESEVKIQHENKQKQQFPNIPASSSSLV